ncbi:MAG: Hpt domain-containing protein [Hymenobacteraceae bacterium]|nr:Hpt domain-containing protein [Hymenobacteraceae bacterium]MDX5395477.1 Hpt domain-containing protein [Hymenobacteraceae bacterium]MDX5443101.1 Hpt domain-containing protein [Hymenobacteraceae bacterium]MDX5511529.1 Hpt domain-containing protein [Hymenobacteraceae bacterium]
MTKPNPTEQQNTDKLYDLTLLEKMSRGNQQFMLRMLILFMETVPPSVQQMQESFRLAEWQELSKQAHKLKSTLDTMGIASLKEPIRKIENDAKNMDNPVHLQAELQQLDQVVKKVLTQIDEQINLLNQE